jgi:hypothetical protein
MLGRSLAVAPVNAVNITGAQEYGKSKANASLNEFFQPWTVYEEKAAMLDDTAERAYLYTPYLLIAADARDKVLAGNEVTLADVEKVLTDYNGYMIFGVTLFSPDAGFSGKVSAKLRQGSKVTKAYLIDIPPAGEKPASDQVPYYQAQGFIYFLIKDIDLDKPVSLQIITRDKRQHHFYFNLRLYR